MREFVGTGWKFNIAEQDGRIDSTSEESLIRQSIEIILGTAKGERQMRPDFGCGIHELVFSVNNSTTRSRVITEVRRALVLWEPRIEVQDVSVDTETTSPGVLLISITYTILAINTTLNQVYPFYIDQGFNS